MRHFFPILIYPMFFLSGAAALMYQVVWVRSLSLVFGGSHLAVATVLSVFMAGLAIGGYTIGRYADRVKNQLRLYGWLEIGIALFAVLFFFLNRAYPDIYRFLAKGKDDAYLYLTLIRILFSVVVLIPPTVLMGGTLPVLTRLVSRQPRSLRKHLSFLYGINTFGAVLGALTAGFYFLRFYSVTTTLALAIALNISIGIISLLLQRKRQEVLQADKETVVQKEAVPIGSDFHEKCEDKVNLLPLRLVLLGAGVSGFCALGYEVLWTRMLAVVSGATVYAFTTMLAAFLTGIALGSAVFGLIPGVFQVRDKGVKKSVVWFGIIQVAIGILALVVTVLIGDLPENMVRVHNFLADLGLTPAEVRMRANFILAFTYMLIPTFFMGVAFPLAGKIHAAHRKRIGAAVGEVLFYNTVGAILGATISGFVLISLFGIERSLQMLVTVNIGFGILVWVSVRGKKFWNWSVAAGMAGFLIFLSLDQNTWKLWNNDHFAIFRSNEMANFFAPELIPLMSEFTNVLYYGEGLETIVTVTNVGDRHQSLIVNGKVVATNIPQDLQLQFSLGHLPMLLHPDPKRVLVVGLGTGMTLGAASVHPNVEELILAEIEPKVVPAARTFGDLNHHVLDNPSLKIIYNDGRNFLYTTDYKFDVITADPIHPWAQGASYLYTEEYYRTVLKHLSPNGIMCQWLPLYELSTVDWRSVVTTFRSVFPEVMLWVTHSDGILIGSKDRILLDEPYLDSRIAHPEIHKDLAPLMMGSSADLLSYFVSGTDGLEKFSSGGVLNTDNNLYLEFSAPLSVGMPRAGKNLKTIVSYRESILPYLTLASGNALSEGQIRHWKTMEKAARLTDQAQILVLEDNYRSEEYGRLASLLDENFPEFPPWKFLKTQVARKIRYMAAPLQGIKLIFSGKEKEEIIVAISATKITLSDDVSVIVLADQNKKIKGYFRNLSRADNTSALVGANQVLIKIREIYQKQIRIAAQEGLKYPDQKRTMGKIDKYLGSLSKRIN